MIEVVTVDIQMHGLEAEFVINRVAIKYQLSRRISFSRDIHRVVGLLQRPFGALMG